MWVSRKEFDKLRGRVAFLELQAHLRVQDDGEIFGGLPSEPLTVARVVSALARKVGLKYYPGTPAKLE